MGYLKGVSGGYTDLLKEVALWCSYEPCMIGVYVVATVTQSMEALFWHLIN